MLKVSQSWLNWLHGFYLFCASESKPVAQQVNIPDPYVDEDEYMAQHGVDPYTSNNNEDD